MHASSYLPSTLPTRSRVAGGRTVGGAWSAELSAEAGRRQGPTGTGAGTFRTRKKTSARSASGQRARSKSANYNGYLKMAPFDSERYEWVFVLGDGRVAFLSFVQYSCTLYRLY